MDEHFATFEEFWPYYVRAHSKPITRALHAAGSAAALVCLAAFVRNPRRLWLLPAALVAGYGPAWVGHFVIEKNRPATWQYPLWSLRADGKMLAMMLRGEMAAEVARHMAPAPAADAPPARSSRDHSVN